MMILGKRVLITFFFASLMFGFSHNIHAADLSPNGASQKAISLYLGSKHLEERPLDLESAFKYGKLALELNEKDEAKFAFNHILSYDPKVMGAKFELAMIYYDEGELDKAKPLFEDILQQNPSLPMKQQVQPLLDSINGILNEHLVTILASMELGSDTNANFAGKSGNITIIDPISANETLIHVNDNSNKNIQDTKIEVSVAVEHSYKIEQDLIKEARMRWNSSVSYHQNVQNEADNVELSVVTVKTGPEITLPALKTTFSADVAHTNVNLHGSEYLQINHLNFNSNYQHSDKMSFALGLKLEDRNYLNSSTINTYSDRDGMAQQVRIGANYKLTPRNILEGTLSYRNENTQRTYLDNSQVNLSGNYLRLFNDGLFSKLSLGFKRTKYDGSEPLFSSVSREDRERVVAFQVGKPISENVTFSLGYQFKNIGSNIPNYDFHNHKITSNFTYKMNLNSLPFLKKDE